METEIALLFFTELLSQGVKQCIAKIKSGRTLEKILNDTFIELRRNYPDYSEIVNNLEEMFKSTPLDANIMQDLIINRDLASFIELFRKTGFYKKYGDEKYLTNDKINEIFEMFVKTFEEKITNSPQLKNELQLLLLYTKEILTKVRELNYSIQRPPLIVQFNYIVIGPSLTKDKTLDHLTTKLKLAGEYGNQNRFSEAIKEYQYFFSSPYAKEHPDYWKACNNFGRAFFEEGQLQKAMSYLKEAYFMKPENPEVMTNFATLYINLDSLNEAEPLLKQVIDMHPDFHNAYNSYGLLLGRQGKTKDGILEIEKAINIAPDRSYYHSSKAHLLSELAEYDAALTAVQEALNLKPSNYQYHIERGTYYLLKAHNVKPPQPYQTQTIKFETQRIIGKQHMQLQPPIGLEDAVKCFDKAIALGAPDNDAQLVINRSICLIEMGEYQRAEKMLLKLCTADKSEEIQLAVGLNLITLYSWTDKIDSAEAIFNGITGRYDESKLQTIYKTMSTAYIYAGKCAEALPLLEKVVKKDISEAKLLVNMGVCLTELKRYEEATEYFEIAIDKDKGLQGAYWNLGMCYFFRKMYGNAAVAFDKARSFDSSFDEPNLYIALSYMRTGRKHEALKELEVLLTKDPDKILIKGYLVDLYYNIGNLEKCRLYLNDILNTTPPNSHNYNAAKQRFIHHFGYHPTKK